MAKDYKNYIQNLTDEELKYICQQIGGKTLRDELKKIKIIGQIIKGRRIEKMTDEQTFECVVNNRKTVVAGIVNAVLCAHLPKLIKNYEEQLSDTSNDDILLAEILSDSIFSGEPEIYFKLTEGTPPIDDDNHNLFYHMVELKRQLKTTIYEQQQEHNTAEQRLKELRERHSTEAAILEANHKKAIEALQGSLAEAERELKDTKRDLTRCSDKLKTEQQTCAELKQIKLAVEAHTAQQKHLADDVQALVLAKIDEAKTNAAEFIAQNAFIHTGQTQDNQKPSVIKFSSSRQFAASQEPDMNDNYQDLLATIQSELDEAGVCKKFIRGLSALLYSAFINHIPLLLAGPSGSDIAEALSIALDCRMPAVLTCEGSFDSQAVLECNNSKEQLVVIEQPFNPQWCSNIIKMISKRDRLYILVHPFAEDLPIEPKGLWNYCVPILTELFVEKLPNRQYFGGQTSDKYEQYKPETTDGSNHYRRLLNAMKISSIVYFNINRLLNDIHALLDTKDSDADYVLLLYPLAFVRGNTIVFLDRLKQEREQPSKDIIEMLERLIGDGNETV